MQPLTLHRTEAELSAGLDWIRQSPADAGTVELIVRRPARNEREVLQEGRLDPLQGLAGDGWSWRGSSMTPDGTAHPELQLTLMNARAAALVAGAPERRALAGDQLYVDLDLAEANLPPGTRLAIGPSAIVEVSALPHTGCKKFVERFGLEAMQFVNSPTGRRLRLRGLNARVVTGGVVRPGDPVRRLA